MKVPQHRNQHSLNLWASEDLITLLEECSADVLMLKEAPLFPLSTKVNEGLLQNPFLLAYPTTRKPHNTHTQSTTIIEI